VSRAERMLPFQRPGTVRGGRPPLGLGVATSVLSVAAATAAIYPLKNIAPAVSLSVVYLPAVLLVSAYWGLPLGLFTSLLGAGAFNFFHLPPVGHFTIADGRNWWALGAFMLVAVVVSTMAELARSRAVEAERRRAEADLAAALARELLAGSETADALAGAARRVAEALALRSASIELGATELRVILREAGFEALPASTGEEALDAAALQPPDAGIIDLLLPDMDGIEVCRRLREWTQMPLIVLSAVGEEDAKVRRWPPARTTT
jgi:K+-sensing histidine kinase KdpD